LVFLNIFYGYSENKPIISQLEKGQSAEVSGLKVGDIILEVNNTTITDLISLKDIISKNNNKNVLVTYSRNDLIYSIDVLVENKRIGIRGTIEKRKLNFFNSCLISGKQIFYFVKITLIGIYEMITGSRGAEDLGGPIRIAQLAGEFWSQGIQQTLWFMMIISLNLGLINLFPVPMLDGGHLMLNFIEFLKGEPLNNKVLEVIHTIGFAILISLILFTFYNDSARYFQ